MSFNINNKVIFIDSFQFLSSSLDILVKNLGKDDFNYFSVLVTKNMNMLLLLGINLKRKR